MVSSRHGKPVSAMLAVVALICSSGILLGQGRPERAAPTVRDSAGVRIIEHVSIANAPAAFTLSPAPYLQLGGLRTNLEEEFDSRHPFLAPTRLSDGRIAVADWASIKLFDGGGKFLGSHGRKGQGPGEFTQLRRLCLLPGDTLLAIDHSDRRASLWNRDGKLISALRAVDRTASQPCFPDGTLLVERAPADAGDAPSRRVSRRYARVRLDGTTVAELGAAPEEIRGPIELIPSAIATTDGIWVADGKAFAIELRSLSGQPVRVIRVNAPVIEVTDAMFQARVEAMIPATGSPEQRARLRARLMRMPPPATVPAYGEVRLDQAGRLWIQDYESRDRWAIFESGGVLVGTMTLPKIAGESSGIAAFEKDGIVLSHRDEDGALRLSFHRLLPVRR